jgi:hypothetical protein
MANKNFIVKNGLEVGGQEVVSSSGVVTSAALGGQTLSSTDSPTFNNLTLTNDIAVGGDLNLTGDLNITGDVNSLSVTDLDVTDQTITLGAGQVESASGGSGIIIDGSNASILWDETNTEFDINNSINVTGSVTSDGSVISGSASSSSEIIATSLDNGTSFGSNRMLKLIGTSTTDNSRMGIHFTGNTGIGNGLGIIEAVNEDQSEGHTSLRMHTYSGSWNENNLVLKSGNVGIGTSSLSRQLQLYKSSNSSYNSSSMETTNLQLYIRNADTTVNNHVGLQFAVGNNSDAAIAGVRTSDANVALTFGTRGTGSGNIIERMRIDSSGNVLVGTTSSTNTGKLRIQSATASGGDSVALTLHQANFSNGGATLIKIGTEANNFAKSAIGFKRTDSFDRGSIIFCQENSADGSNVSSSNEVARINSSGRLLVDTDNIGNASTNAKVVCDSEFLSRGSSAGYFWENRTGMTIASQSGWGGWYSTGTASHFLYSDGANRASIGRTSGTYTALSDVNKKKDFEDSTVGLAEVMQLQPKKFRMIDDADDAPKKLGFVAQDVENIIPEAYVEDLADDENEETFIGLTDRPIIAALTKAIQEQQTIIDDLKARLDEAGL